MRLFAAIVPPEYVLDNLARSLSRFTDGPQGRRNPWQPAQNWHLTLAFYGDVPDDALDSQVERLAHAAAVSAPATLRLAGCGTFRDKVAWIGLAGDTGPVTELMAALAPANARPGGGPDFPVPHLTISRWANHPNVKAALRQLADYEGPEWTADAIVLLESRLGAGPAGHSRYEELASAPLLAL
ncbi:MAG: RNA 2',3'-cyclic phosphodiesterase [Bifidobacteriaceae bacterium]|jgi:2'-5' RNA ligase|nr:RNA 2',3'-cyclic phosphodiesterase [Bifidobacteriaceae bacterium]